MKGNKGKSYTPYYIAIIIAGVVIYKIWEFASRPDALEQTLAFLGGVALCFGASVLLIAVSLIAPSLASKIKKRPLPRITDLQYEVDAARTKPAVDTWEGYSLIGFGVLYVLVSLGFCYVLVAGLIDALEGIRGIGDINLFEICAGLFSALLALAQGVFSICTVVAGISTLVRNQNWMRGTKKARATIVDRIEEQTITAFDYKYGGCTITYELILRVEGQPEVPELDGRLIRADVSKRIFNRYARRDSAVIYYDTHSPLTFVLRGE
jgi:hypothetical protein